MRRRNSIRVVTNVSSSSVVSISFRISIIIVEFCYILISLQKFTDAFCTNNNNNVFEKQHCRRLTYEAQTKTAAASSNLKRQQSGCTFVLSAGRRNGGDVGADGGSSWSSRESKVSSLTPMTRKQQQQAVTKSTTLYASRSPLSSVTTNHNLLPYQQKQSLYWQKIRNNGEWMIPPRQFADDNIFGTMNDENSNDQVEERAVQLAATLVRERIQQIKNEKSSTTLSDQNDSSLSENDDENNVPLNIYNVVKGKFIDLACSKEGETILENLFLSKQSIQTILEQQYTQDEILGAIIVFHSLCIMGTQVGVKGLPEQLKRMVSHLADDSKNDNGDLYYMHRDYYIQWDHDSVRRLKYRLDRTPAIELLSVLQRKRVNQGAFDLLVDLGVWSVHEDLALLRSGFPLRFSPAEEQVAQDAYNNIDHSQHQQRLNDPDTILGIRQDLRHLKVYTIDGESTSEIDDGISIEKIVDPSNNNNNDDVSYRIWIHIADADRWAPRNSSLLEIARRRITSLYLPNGPIPMFPDCINDDLMSLKANKDVCALSLGVQLNNTDGSIDTTKPIIVTPSIINVNYRLSYDDVDEMLEEGIGYSEEWELGILLDAAIKRRQYRIQNGSAEGAVPNPIPYSSITLIHDDGTKVPNEKTNVQLNIQVSHNAAKNKTALAEDDIATVSSSSTGATRSVIEDPLSSAYLLVTECMILAGEAIGTWKSIVDKEEESFSWSNKFKNQVRLPFRTQGAPDYNSRARERNVLMNLLECNVGGGLCHAWYARRFLQSVRVQEVPMGHSGLGLKTYVQWSSPIRRFSDLQVHASVKRYLRRRRLYELVSNKTAIPQGIRPIDLGISAELFQSTCTSDNDANGESLNLIKEEIQIADLDQDINFLDGIGLVGAAKNLQRSSQQYWLFEYIRRIQDAEQDAIYKGCILGCIDPERQQYAIYIYELGLEHRYTSPTGRLDPGTTLLLRVDNVTPRAGLLNFVRVV